MKLIRKLNDNMAGIENDTRKQHIESMEALSKEGYPYMEIRATEISPEDLQYFRDQGMTVQAIDDEEVPYFRIIWNHTYNSKVNTVATISATTMAGLEVLWKVTSPLLAGTFKFFKLFL